MYTTLLEYITNPWGSTPQPNHTSVFVKLMDIYMYMHMYKIYWTVSKVYM